MLHVAAFAVAFTLCGIYTLLAGARPEQFAMLAQSCALLLSVLTVFLRVSATFQTLVLGWALADVLLAIALTILALHANRNWTIVLAGLQVAAVLIHAAKLLFPSLPASGYAMFVQLWAWPMLIVTAAGTYNHRRRSGVLGSEKDWKTSSVRSMLSMPEKLSSD